MNKIKHLSIVDGAFLHLDDRIRHLLLPLRRRPTAPTPHGRGRAGTQHLAAPR